MTVLLKLLATQSNLVRSREEFAVVSHAHCTPPKYIFESVNALAEDLLVRVVKENPSAIIPAIENISRVANRKREHEKPLHLADLFF